MQLNKLRTFQNLLIFILSPELFFITHKFIDSSFASMLYTFFFFLFKFPSFSHSLTFFWTQLFILCFLISARGKVSACQCRRLRRHNFGPWVWKIPGGRSGNPLQNSFLETHYRGTWWSTVHGVAESDMT